MNGTTLLKALIAAVTILVLWLRDRGMLNTAEANIAARHLQDTLDDIRTARVARDSVVGDIERNPERLREDDGFKRHD